MLYYNRIDISESIDVNKISASKQYIICHYWHLLEKGFKFQSIVCNDWHDVLIMPIDVNNIAIYGVDYLCIILGIRKIEAINLFRKILI